MTGQGSVPSPQKGQFTLHPQEFEIATQEGREAVITAVVSGHGLTSRGLRSAVTGMTGAQGRGSIRRGGHEVILAFLPLGLSPGESWGTTGHPSVLVRKETKEESKTKKKKANLLPEQLGWDSVTYDPTSWAHCPRNPLGVSILTATDHGR